MTTLCHASQFQSHIGAFQWLVSLGRFDILQAIQSLGRFRATPSIGHLERAKRIYGYLCKYKNVAIRFPTSIPDFSDLPEQEYDWMKTVYGNCQEEIPDDAPTILGIKYAQRPMLM